MSVFSLPTELEAAPEWVHDVYRNLPPLASFYDLAPLVGVARGTMSNMLSDGRGTTGGLIVGRKRSFPRLNLALWLMDVAKAKEAKASWKKGA